MKRVIKYCQLAGLVLVSCIVGLCLFLDGVGGKEKVTEYLSQSKQIEFGIIAQQQFLTNRIRINKMMAEIKRLRIEDGNLLKNVLKANNIVLESDEQCSIDLKTWTLHFKKNEEGLR